MRNRLCRGLFGFVQRQKPSVMRLRMAVVMSRVGYRRSHGSGRQHRCWQGSRMVRDPAYRLRKCQGPLHRQKTAEQKDHQMAGAGVHEYKLTQLDMRYKTCRRLQVSKIPR